MRSRKWAVRALMLVIACAVLGGAMIGCESTGGGGYSGSDGHVGHNH